MAGTPTDIFTPTWPRVLFAGAVALGGFFLPQEVPLEYYPLNDPSDGLQYLEITCAADRHLDVTVWLDQGRGFNDLDSIRWPVEQGELALTYVFPLRDAPIIAIRLDPNDGGAGELTISAFRLTNRRGDEIIRFDEEDLVPLQGIDSIVARDAGWAITTLGGAVDPQIGVNLPAPIVAEGMNGRNLQRFLLSWGYLAFILWVIALASYLALRPQTRLRPFLRSAGFLLYLSLILSAVGNRGQLQSYLAFARAGEQLESSAEAPS